MAPRLLWMSALVASVGWHGKAARRKANALDERDDSTEEVSDSPPLPWVHSASQPFPSKIPSEHLPTGSPPKRSQALGSAESTAGENPVWTQMKAKFEATRSQADLVAMVGAVDKETYIYEPEGGTVGMDTPIPVASLSKFASVVGILAGAEMSWLDMPVREALNVTLQPDDSRYGVTLRHLLTFTSGFNDGLVFHNVLPFQVKKCLNSLDLGDYTKLIGFMGSEGSKFTLVECGTAIFKDGTHYGTPGQVWDYNSIHLQIAGAVILKLRGMEAGPFFRKYLFLPAGMNSSVFNGNANPELSAGLRTTPRDLFELMRRLTAGKILSAEQQEAFSTEYAVANNVSILDCRGKHQYFPGQAMGGIVQDGKVSSKCGLFKACLLIDWANKIFLIAIPKFDDLTVMLQQYTAYPVQKFAFQMVYELFPDLPAPCAKFNTSWQDKCPDYVGDPTLVSTGTSLVPMYLKAWCWMNQQQFEQ